MRFRFCLMSLCKCIAGILLYMALAVTVSGCAGSNKELQRLSENHSQSYQVADMTGSVLSFSEKPKRIVSFSVSTDEILLELVSPDRIAAITKLADNPAVSNVVDKAKTIPTRVAPTAEAILALNPDVVIIPDFHRPEVIQSLRDMKVPIYLYKTPSTINEVENSIRQLATLVKEERKGEKIIAGMAKPAGINAIGRERRRESVL